MTLKQLRRCNFYLFFALTALVLEQVNNFGSLPHRKQFYRRPVQRSKSDASSTNKKPKRSSILNIFSSTPTATSNNHTNSNSNNKTNKKVVRSKSDVSSQSSNTDRRDKYRKKIHLNSNLFHNNLTSSDSDNAPSFLTHKKVPLSPITEVNTPLFSETNNNRSDYFDNPKLTNDERRHSKSMETMHSSQLPVDKLPLTRGMAVDKMVKRLSTERLSPPPAQILQAGAFSYTNPVVKSLSPPLQGASTDVVYAQVVCNETINADGSKTIQSKETVHDTYRQSASPSPRSPTKSNHEKILDHDTKNDFLAKSPSPGSTYPYRNSIKIETEFDRDEVDNNTSEPVIKPVNIRNLIPRHPSNTNINYINNYHNLDNEFDQLNEMRDADTFNGAVDTSLSSRRKILESRIKSRIDGLHFNNNDNHQHISNIRKSTSPPPPPTTAQLRYGKYGGSNEIVNRYSPERSHHLTTSSKERHVSKANYSNGKTLPKKIATTTLFTKNEKGDSGIEADNTNGMMMRTSRGRSRKTSSSRFNTG